MSKNDDKILFLKQKIEEKKKQMGKATRFSPTTSCSIELDGQRYNLHAASKDQLIFLACKIQALSHAAEQLGYNKECMISGFPTVEWRADIMARLELLDRKDEEAKLKAMEAQLDKLLSEDKKTELELAAIEALLW